METRLNIWVLCKLIMECLQIVLASPQTAKISILVRPTFQTTATLCAFVEQIFVCVLSYLLPVRSSLAELAVAARRQWRNASGPAASGQSAPSSATLLFDFGTTPEKQNNPSRNRLSMHDIKNRIKHSSFTHKLISGDNPLQSARQSWRLSHIKLGQWNK